MDKTNKDFKLFIFSVDMVRHTITLCKEIVTEKSGKMSPNGTIKCMINIDVEQYAFNSMLLECIITINVNKVISIRQIAE